MSRYCSGVWPVWNPLVTCSHGHVFLMHILLHFLCLFALAFLCNVVNSDSHDCLEFLTSWPCYHNMFFLSSADFLSLLIPLSLSHMNVLGGQSLSMGLCQTSLVTSPGKACLLFSLPCFYFSTIYLST